MSKIRVAIAGTVGKSVLIDTTAGVEALAAVRALEARLATGISGVINHNSLLNLQVGDAHPQYAGNTFPETITGQWNFSTIPFIEGETLAEYIEEVVGGDIFDFLQDTPSVVWTYFDTAGELEANVPPEFVEVTVADFIVDSATVTWDYNETAGTLTANATLDASATFITADDERASFPASFRLAEGTNVTFDYNSDGEVVINASSGGGGIVDTVVAGAGIDVDATDPANPSVAVEASVISGAAAGATAVQPARAIVSGGGLTGGGDLSADRTLAVGAGTGITVNANDVALSAAALASLALADSSTQPGDNVSTLVNDAGYLTTATLLANNLINREAQWSEATAGDNLGLTTTTSGGTAQAPTLANTNAFTRQPRRRWITSTSANQTAGIRTNAITQLASRSQGFRSAILGGQVNDAGGQRVVLGLNSVLSSALATVDPSAQTDVAFFAKDVADTNLQFMHNDSSGTCTKVDLGFTWASLSGVLLLATIYCDPAASGLSYELRNCNTGTVIASGTVTSNIPATGVTLGPQFVVGNAATGAAVAMEISLMNIKTAIP